MYRLPPFILFLYKFYARGHEFCDKSVEAARFQLGFGGFHILATPQAERIRAAARHARLKSVRTHNGYRLCYRRIERRRRRHKFVYKLAVRRRNVAASERRDKSVVIGAFFAFYPVVERAEALARVHFSLTRKQNFAAARCAEAR